MQQCNFQNLFTHKTVQEQHGHLLRSCDQPLLFNLGLHLLPTIYLLSFSGLSLQTATMLEQCLEEFLVE